jgi:hypothetical protein
MGHKIPHNQNLLAHNSTPETLTCAVNWNIVEDQHKMKFRPTRPKRDEKAKIKKLHS